MPSSRSRGILTCTFPGCERKFAAWGYCHGHYAHLRKYGAARELESPKRKRWAGKICAVQGCDRDAKCKALCRSHYSLCHRYTLTPEQVIDLLSTGRCECCDLETKLVIDHDHNCCPTTPACEQCIRGVLCESCNKALGAAGDTVAGVRQLLAYLEKEAQHD